MATVADLYASVLGRAPDAGGLAYWESMFGSTVDPTEAATFLSVANVTEPVVVQTTKDIVDKWFADNPNATTQQLVNAVQAAGGINAAPDLASVLADKLGTGTNEIIAGYNNLVVNSPPAQNKTSNATSADVTALPDKQPIPAPYSGSNQAALPREVTPDIPAQPRGGPVQAPPPMDSAAPAGLLDWKSQIFSSLDTAKTGAPKQLEFNPIEYRESGAGEGATTVAYGGGLKTGGVEAETIGGGDSEPIITGYLSKTPTTVNGLSVYAHYDPTGKLDYYAAPEATWIDDKTTVRGMWDAEGNPTLNVQQGGGGFVKGLSTDLAGLTQSLGPVWTAAKIAMPELALVDVATDVGRSEVNLGTALNAYQGMYGKSPFTTGTPPTDGTTAPTTTPTVPNTGSTMLDYTMPTAKGGLGLQGTAALDGTLSSGLAANAAGSLGGGLGLNAGLAGNLSYMGGGQGLTGNAIGGGTLSAGGVNTGLFTADNLYNGTTSITNPIDKTGGGGTGTKITVSDVIKTLPLVTTIAGLTGGGVDTSGGGSTGPTGFDIVEVPSSWKPPTYTGNTGGIGGSGGLDLNKLFTDQNLLIGTQWEGLPNQRNLTFNDIFAAGQQSTPMGTPVNINNLVSAILGQNATSQKSA